MTQREALDLLERATADLPLDLDSIVAGGVRRGRIRRRNRRVGTTIALAAVAGVVSLGAAVLPLGADGGGEVATDPSVGPSQTTAPPPTVPAPRVFSASGKDFPAIVAGLAGIADVEGPLMTAGYGVADGPDTWSAFFRLNGALTSVYTTRGDPALGEKSCRNAYENCRQEDEAWVGSRAGGPQDGVSYNSATAWVGPYAIGLGSYNAAEGKSSPLLSERPQLSPEVLEQMALDPVWFTPAP